MRAKLNQSGHSDSCKNAAHEKAGDIVTGFFTEK
jgi:hypothetical protein